MQNHLRSVARVTAIVVLALCAAPVGPLTAQNVPLKKEDLGNGIYVFSAPLASELWTATNAVVVVGDVDVTVFDSNTRPATARTVIAAIRQITNLPVRTLINSHWHMDHWSGNDEYAKAFPGIRIIATTETRDYMKRMSGPFFASGLAGSVAQAKSALDTAIRTGKLADGSPLTAEARKSEEADVAQLSAFLDEVRTVPRVLPNFVYRDTLVFWSGTREFRLISVTGDATGSTVLYLPADKVLVMGDVLAGPESGAGPPPWTTNSYAIAPWLRSLRALAALDAVVVVPGQGAAFHDKTYLNRTADLFAAITGQVHAALERGLVTAADVRAAVNVDSIGRLYSPSMPDGDPRFQALVAALVRKVHQAAYDGVVK